MRNRPFADRLFRVSLDRFWTGDHEVVRFGYDNDSDQNPIRGG
jgi:hypothetical protein